MPHSASGGWCGGTCWNQTYLCDELTVFKAQTCYSFGIYLLSSSPACVSTFSVVPGQVFYSLLFVV